MTTSTLIRAIKSRWDAKNLDDFFTNLRGSTSSLPVLCDTEARPSTPFPYCIFEQGDSRTINRMSGAGDATLPETTEKQGNETRQTEISFTVHAKTKPQCETLIDKINQAFKKVPFFTGHLNTQYVTDSGVRSGDNEWQWVIVFNFVYDIAVALNVTE